jgi:hypothetical protein
MDDHMSEVNERLTASCGATLQQLDDIEAKLAGLHEAIERSCGPAHEAWRPAAAADVRLELAVTEAWTRV